MQVDVGTIYLAGGLAGVIASGAMYTGHRIVTRYDGVGFLTLALLMLGVASALFGLHREIGNGLAFGVADPLLAASALSFRFAVDRLRDTRRVTRIPQFTVAFVCLVEWGSLIADTSGVVRACVGAVGTAVALLVPVAALLKWSEPWASRGRIIAGTAFSVAAAASLARGSVVWADPASVPFTAFSLANLCFAVATLGIVAATAVAILVMLREHQRARLQMLDALTEIFNRDAFLDQGARVLSLGKRRDLACSVVLINLDRFRRVNETHGYGSGDEVLRHIASQARGQLRPEDLLGRTSSAEFAMMLFATPAVGAEAVARRLKVALAAHPPRVGGAGIPVTASIGIAEWRPGSPLDASVLLKHADLAVQEAKVRGRDTIVRYDELAKQPAATP
jgi:diguanylate cyclase (GGDEF)-like protein